MIVDTIGSLIVAAIGAGVGWGLTEFAARPIRRFFDLRGEVIRRLAQYGDIPTMRIVDDGSVEDPPEGSDARAREAASVIRDLAAQMISFAYNGTLARTIISALRYNPHEAAEGLFAVSWTIQASGDLREKPRRRVADALRVERSMLF